MIGTVISWAVFGLVVGWIARLLYPGPQALSLFKTMLLGIIGSFVGGFIVYLFRGAPDHPFEGAGWIMSIIGSILVVWSGLFISKQR
ncbi:MAG: GlsB/YeaQ/YmgE family stress response membrane protein [Planctomycetota bacterium]|nr:GlsB/YeaQ/YmgE family stress response membrane protein [Planctomycetota bacterium]